jgi:salicylate hydroxylase
MESWTRGAVTLLGDAAHPMLPYLAQGACMAMEDGYVLADTLAKSQDDVLSALQQYEAARRERTAKVQLLARQRARENHLTSEEEIRKRDMRFAEIRARGQTEHVYGIEWIYSHDVT